MSKVKLGLKGMPLWQKFQLACRVSDALGEHSDIFPDPPVDSDHFTDYLATLNLQMSATASLRTQLREAVALERDAAAVLFGALTQLGIYVERVSGGDGAIIALAAMDVSRTPSPVGALPSPSGVAIVNGPGAGELVLRWKPLRGAMSYYVEQLADGASPDAWTAASAGTKAKATVKGLESGRKYWFRVAAIGSAGQGAWSAAVGMRAG